MERARADAERPRVVVVGAGFGGLEAATRLRKAPVDLTVIDRRNFHLFQPLLYQVATGGLSPGDIASPVRRALRKNPRARVWMGEVLEVDLAARCVRLADGDSVAYDTLVLAPGAETHYFGHDEKWAPLAPGLKSVEDALEMRRRVFGAFEAAERETDPRRQRALLSFVVVGGGPTGVELAGALAELANDTLRSDFRAIDPSRAWVLLVEGSDRVLPGYPDVLSRDAAGSLRRLGADIRLETFVREVDSLGVVLERAGDGARERVRAATVLWAAGVRASPLGAGLARAAGIETDREGRIPVQPDLTLPGHPEVFVIGDLARFEQDGEPVPGIAPVAMQQGRHAADAIRARLRGAEPKPFVYRDRGKLATIGRSAAVADFGWLRFSGLPAWLLWLGVHIVFLIEFENRVAVLVKWAFNYVTRNRGARLIAGAPGTQPPEP